jgi:hypothetical protein
VGAVGYRLNNVPSSHVDTGEPNAAPTRWRHCQEAVATIPIRPIALGIVFWSHYDKKGEIALPLGRFRNF